MRRIQVITQKELVDSNRSKRVSAVVIDVLLATSTVAFLLDCGYGPIYTAKGSDHAKEIKKKNNVEGPIFGEENGAPIQGFKYPDPTLLEKIATPNPAIICTTNGTRAVEAAKNSVDLYLSSLVNGSVVADYLHQRNDSHTILLICSGNGGSFSAEDFVGAGQIVDHLLTKGPYSLSDSAMIARESYLHSKAMKFSNLYESETAALLYETGYGKATKLVIDSVEKVRVLPKYVDGKIVDMCKTRVLNE